MAGWMKRLDLPGLVFIVGTGVFYSIRGEWSPYHTAVAVLGAAALVASLAARRAQFRALFSGRRGRYGANSVTSVVLLFGILALVNYIGATRDQRLDVTAEGFNSLADQSRTVADQVVEDVHIRAFFPSGDDQATRQLLGLYQNRNPRISFEFIDPDSQPQLARQYDVTVYGIMNNPLSGQNRAFGTLVLEMGTFTERIELQEPVREEDLTNALVKLIKGEQKAIYFVQGHGEKSVGLGEQGGMDTAVAALERENYRVETLNLVTDEAIPDDAALLIWAGPENEPFDEEVDRVDDYLSRGGSVLAMVDPSPSASLAALLDRWSVAVGNNFVVDASGVGRLLGAGPEIPLVLDYPPHAITERFGGVMTFFPFARSVSAALDPADNITVTDLLRTNARSWGETDMENTEASLDPEVDLPGPLNVGVVVTGDLGAEAGEGQMARLVVVGDSEFAGNGYFDQQGNGNLFLNIVSWLAEDESFISVRPRVPDDRPLTMTQSQGQVSMYLSMVLLPLGIVAAGISVWMKRRKQ